MRQDPEATSLYNLLLATRPGLTTEEVYALHRGIDVLLGLLLLANLMRSVGIFIGEDGTLSFSISGPLVTRPLLEAILGQGPPRTLEFGPGEGT